MELYIYEDVTTKLTYRTMAVSSKSALNNIVFTRYGKDKVQRDIFKSNLIRVGTLFDNNSNDNDNKVPDNDDIWEYI